MNYQLSPRSQKLLEESVCGYRFFQEAKRWPNPQEMAVLVWWSRRNCGLGEGERLVDIVKKILQNTIKV